jgi:hypothetical protein
MERAAMSTKKCIKCEADKELTEFYRQGGGKQGLTNRCKVCTLAAHKANRAANLEEIRAKDRERAKLPHRVALREEYLKTDGRRESVKKYAKKYSEVYAKRRKAQQMVNNAINRGLMERQPCIICGDCGQAHHPDYDAPMDVVWLCHDHHKETHALARQINREVRLCGTEG